MSPAAVQIDGLSKHYPLTWKRKTLIALDKLDLTIERGEIFGLLGPNGSGKSTTLKLILGLLKPTAGEIQIFGVTHDSVEGRQRIGFLPENPYFYKFLSGEETLRFYGKLCGVKGAALEKKIKELIALVGLEHGKGRPLSAYSKGMLQRIGLAQALIHDPELLLLDEPTAGVDPIGSREIRDLILKLKEMGKTVVFSSHLLEQVQEVADRVAILNLGKKIIEGSLTDLLTIQTRTQIGVENLSESNHEQLRGMLEKMGGKNISISRPNLTLENLFLKAVEGKGAKSS
jgi:ABC-2 type transport system ATP-binding protein